MSETALKRLVGALFVVGGVWIVAVLLSGGGGSIRASGAINDFFTELDPDSVQVVRITRAGVATELRRNGGEWTANDYDADIAPVVQLLNTLRMMEVGDLVATNPANHERMGVSQDSAATFELDLSDGGSRTLLVGKQGPRFATSYARLPGEDEVYLLEGDIRGHLQRAPDDWRNKRYVAVDTALVQRIEVERDGSTYALVRGDSVWALEGGGDADAAQVRNVLAELSGSLASGFVEAGDPLLDEGPGGSNVAYGADGAPLAEITLGGGDGDRWVRVVGDSIVYRLAAFRVERLAPTLEAMSGGS